MAKKWFFMQFTGEKTLTLLAICLNLQDWLQAKTYAHYTITAEEILTKLFEN